MKTNDLITLLSQEAGPAEAVSAGARLLPVGILGGLVAAALVLGVLGLIPNTMFTEPGPWIKIIYAGSLVLAASYLLTRLGKPGASTKQAVFSVLGTALLMALTGFASYLATPESERTAALMGHSWLICPWTIVALSLPVMVGAFWAMKGLAPTNLPLAGAACGLFAGSVAALAYAFACTEPAAPFIAIWYTLGIALCSALGALLGPKLLNW